MRKALGLMTLPTLLILLPGLVNAQATIGQTRVHADVSNVFTRLERAWAAYQLKATTALYDGGDVVVAAAAPTQEQDLFNPYRLQPGAREDRSFQLTQANDVAVTLCVNSVVKNSDELNGFLQGMRQSGAQFATGDCQAATLNGNIGFPAQVFARKVVTAKRAAELIAKDSAERAAQQAVADTITFALPDGKLLNFTAQPNQSSSDAAAVLGNSSGAVWQANAQVVDGPFSVSTVGCEAVAPTGSCVLNVSFHPTATGKFTGHVRVTTVAGKDLILRLAGTSTAQ